MRRALAVVALVLVLGSGSLGASAASAADGGDPDAFPSECADMGLDDTCIQDANGQWTVLDGGDDDVGFGDPQGDMERARSGFAVLFVLVVIAGIGMAVWRISLSRKVARDAGMDPDVAGQMTLLGDHGLEATYLASQLRPTPQGQPAPASPNVQPPAPPPPTEPSRTVAVRLQELAALRDQGLITEAEYAARREEIIDEV